MKIIIKGEGISKAFNEDSSFETISNYISTKI